MEPADLLDSETIRDFQIKNIPLLTVNSQHSAVNTQQSATLSSCFYFFEFPYKDSEFLWKFSTTDLGIRLIVIINQGDTNYSH
ncbi:hypothetical protein [Nostoc sp. C117]|uniref:hypothetical protein n=1 Tax=Nostoc sp. C117 TaxID=3349875 RepID=UPI00370D01F2